MPGIVGLITKNPKPDHGKAELATMLGSMLHEPSYTHGTYVVPECGFYLGWVSHPDAFLSKNPAVSTSGDKVLVFTGEHFDHDRSTDGVGSRGGKTADHLLNLYERKGEQFLRDINGWFAGMLLDLREQSLLLFNDRFGLCRVYYHADNESFAFASEAKALLSVRPETRQLDTQGVGEFLGVGTALQNRTIFSKIFILPGGSSWIFRRGAVPSKGNYFSPTTWEEQPILPAKAFYDRLYSTMSRILPRYFYPAEHVGLSLTGGLDTRMIMAGRPPLLKSSGCYTYGGVYRRCYDVQVSEEIAAACGERHSTIDLEDDFFRDFSALADETVWLTDGSQDLLGTHEVYFSRRARQLAPIRLTGNYGSEILRSVSYFKYRPPSLALFENETARSVQQAGRTFSEISACHPVSFAAFRQIPWQLFGRLAAAQSQLTVRAPYMDNDLVPLMYQAPEELRGTKDFCLRLISDLSPALASIETDMGDGGSRSALGRFVLRFYRYVLFKGEWYYGPGMPTWLTPFDHNPVARGLASTFLGSHKIDHYRLWFSDRLFNYVSSILNDRDASSRSYLNRHEYGLLVRAHSKRRGNHMDKINKIVTLELIQRSLISRDYRGIGQRVSPKSVAADESMSRRN
jgi:asparagine synthase (glutamine-hydrolysing)